MTHSETHEFLALYGDVLDCLLNSFSRMHVKCLCNPTTTTTTTTTTTVTDDT